MDRERATQGALITLVVVPAALAVIVVDCYGIYHAFEGHSLVLGLLSIVVPPLGLCMGLEGFFWHG